MKKNVRLILLLAMIVAMLALTAVLASAASVSSASAFKAAVEAGGEVTLTADITLTENVSVSKDVTIYGGGKTVTFNGNYGFRVTAGSFTISNVTASSTGTLLLVSGTGNAVINSGSFSGIMDMDAGASKTEFASLTINGGSFAPVAESTGRIFVINSGYTTVTINGGTFTGNGGSSSVFYLSDSNARLYIYGGTFTASGSGHFIEKRNLKELVIAAKEGEAAPQFSHSGTGAILFTKLPDVTTTNGVQSLKQYNTGAVTVTGATFTHSGISPMLYLGSKSAVTLQNCTLTHSGSGSIVHTSNAPTVTLTGCRLTHTGTTGAGANASSASYAEEYEAPRRLYANILYTASNLETTANKNAGLTYSKAATIIFENCTVDMSAKAEQGAIWLYRSNATLKITGGTWVSGSEAPVGFCNVQGTNHIELDGPNLTTENYPTFRLRGGGDTLTVKGGTFTINNGTAEFVNATDAVTVNISGGTFQLGSSNLIYFTDSYASTANISGGTFYSAGHQIRVGNSDAGQRVCKINISGGTFYQTGASNSAILLTGTTQLTVTDGTFVSNNSGYVITFAVSSDVADSFLKIEGGNFTQQGANYLLGVTNDTRYAEGITLPNGTKVGVHITGGTFTAVQSSCINAAGSRICIDGGSFTTATGAVVRMSDNDVISAVIINGGTFTATDNASVIEYAPPAYAQKDEIGSDTNENENGISCITRPLTITGGNFIAENGFVLYLNSIKLKAACDVTITGGTFSGKGESVIYVASPSELTTLTITAGTFKLLDSEKSGAVLRTGFYWRPDGNYIYDNPTTELHIPTKAKITITGGLFVDQRSGNNQVIDVSIGNATVSLKNAVLLSRQRQPYFYLTADAATSVSVSLRSAQCLYGGELYYMWMTTPTEDATMAPALDIGAGVRTQTDSEGIRFTSTVSPAVVARLEAKARALGVSVEYGTLIAPADYVAAAGGFTLEKLNAYVAKHADTFKGDTGRIYVDIPAVKSVAVDEQGGVSFNGVLVDIQSNNYTRVLAAVSYAKVGNNYYYSSYDPTDNARSMAEVAEAALKDVGALGATNAKGKVYAHASVYITYNTAVGSVYSEAVQQVLQGYCGLAALTAETVSPSQFSMVYDTGAAAMVKDYAQLLANSLGITSINGATTAKEILIGETGRAETAAAKAKIRGEGYYVGVINGKIVLVGTSDALTYKALFAFAKRCGAASFTLAESVVSDVSVYDVNDAYFIYSMVRDGNIAYGATGSDYTHSDKDGDGVSDDVGYHVSFVTPGYKDEKNDFAVDYPVKAIVDIHNFLRGVVADDLAWYERDQCKNPTQSVVVSDALTASGLKIHVGLTDSEITKAFLADLQSEYGANAVNSYGYRIKNGEVSILAYSDYVLRQAVALFLADLGNLSDGNGGYAIPATLDYTKTAVAETAWVTDVPMPDLDLDGALDLHDGAYQYHYTGEGVNVVAFQAYCKKLTANGYTLYMKNEIEGSYFYTYVNSAKTRMIHVIYAAFAHADTQPIAAGRTDMLSDMFGPALRVIVAKVDGLRMNLLPTEWVNGTKSYKKVTDTKITSVNIANDSIGNCYVITLEDGTFVVLDGGGGGDEAGSAATLYNVLYQLHTEVHGQAPTKAKPITIAAYMTSHGHNDHYEVFRKFGNTYLNSSTYHVALEAVIANFISDDEAYNCTNPNISLGRNHIGTSSWFYNDATGAKDVPYYKVQTGQKFYLRNVEFEILYTHGDTYPWGLVRFNTSSTVARTTIYNSGATGRTVNTVNTTGSSTSALWLGDLEYRGSRVLRAMYGSYLKSDMGQVAHHAGNGSEGELYVLIDPEIMFIPAKVSSAKTQFAGTSRYADENREWLNGTGWQYIIVMDEYNVTFTVTADGPQMAIGKLQNTADTADEYGDDGEDGVTVQYGQFIITRDTIDAAVGEGWKK